MPAWKGRRIARYTLARISNHLARQASPSGGEQITNPDAKQVNLEHVLPQDIPPDWCAAFSSGVNPADYVYRIGNLTLLRVKDASQLKINEFFGGVSKWGDQEIEKRQDVLAKAALEVWKL